MASQKQHTFYFSYGSNMNPDRMKERGDQFVKREPAKLPGYRLCMNKIVKHGIRQSNIDEDESSVVYGALYTCTESIAIENLAKFEPGSSKKEVKVYLENGEERIAIAFQANPILIDCDDNNIKVKRDYLDHILAGQDLLPPEYVQFLKTFESVVVD